MRQKICAVIALLMLFGALCTIEREPALSLKCLTLSAIPILVGNLWDWKGGDK